ncbi:MAG: Gfo/Idh/MocA family protein [Inquilinaceae bacterium]
MSKLKGAVIGCGFFAENHLNAWRGLDGADLVAVCDRDGDKARAAAARFGVAHAYDDAARLFAEQDLDFVDIATTVDSHVPLVEMAAAHGVPAICQKPFARTLDDARRMVDACAAAGVPLMVHENFRWQAPLMAVRDVLRSGRIGRPFHARIQFRHGYDVYATQPYLATEKRFVILDLGIHLLDVARAYFGEVTRLYCRTQRVNPRVRGEDTATMLLDHADGTRCQLDCSFFTTLDPDPFPQTLVRIEGTAGTVVLDTGYRLSVSDRQGRQERSVEPGLRPWTARPWHGIQDSVFNIQNHWLDCLARGAEPATSGADNLNTLGLVFAAYESAESGRAVVPS